MNKEQVNSYWTSETFQRLVDKFVFRNKITQELRDEISRIDKKKIMERNDGRRILSKLFDGSNEMEEIYGSPEELMHNLEVIQCFPNNSEFLGFPDDTCNYLARLIGLSDTNKTLFFTKIEAFFWYYNTFVGNEKKWKEHLIVQSVGNQINREMKGSFEVVPWDVMKPSLQEAYECIQEMYEDNPDLKISTVDDLFRELSQFYDKEHDQELLAELREYLDSENEKYPLSENEEMYYQLYQKQHYRRYVLDKIFGAYQFGSALRNYYEPYLPKHWFKKKYPAVPVFTDKKLSVTDKFIMAKELEDALDIVMMEKYSKPFPKGLFPVETAEDRVLGIVRVVEWDTFLKVLKIIKLSIDDIHIIEYKFLETTRQNPVPVNSPYGKYCTLARHAFCDIFEQVVVGMRLFRAVNKENCSKIFEWFAQFNDVFSENRKYRYFVETWKTEEIIDRAYQDLEKYATQMPKNTIRINKRGVIEYLIKFSPNYVDQSGLNSAFTVFLLKCDKVHFTSRDVHNIYESSIKNTFPDHNPKYVKFLGNQGIITLRSNEISSGIQGSSSSSSNVEFDEYVRKYKTAFMATLSKIPYDSFIPRYRMDIMIGKELEKNSCPEVLLYMIEPKGLYEISQLVVEFLDTDVRHGFSFVRRKTSTTKVPREFTEMLVKDKDLNDIVMSGAVEILKNLVDGKTSLKSQVEKFCEDVLNERLSEKFKEKSENADEKSRNILLQLSQALKPAPKENEMSLDQVTKAKNIKK